MTPKTMPPATVPTIAPKERPAASTSSLGRPAPASTRADEVAGGAGATVVLVEARSEGRGVEDSVVEKTVDDGASEKTTVWRVTVMTLWLGMVWVMPESVLVDEEAAVLLSLTRRRSSPSPPLLLLPLPLSSSPLPGSRSPSLLLPAPLLLPSSSGQPSKSHGSTEQQPLKRLPTHE